MVLPVTSRFPAKFHHAHAFCFCVFQICAFVDSSKSVSQTTRFRRLRQLATGVSTQCPPLPSDSQFSDTLSLESTFLQSGMAYEFTVTVKSAGSGNCDRDRSATERRIIATQTEQLPDMAIEICKDVACARRIDLVRGAATVNADRRNPNLYLKLAVQSECTTGVDVAWATSMESVHLATKALLDEHTLNPLGYETLKISFNYIYPLAAEYTFSMTAACSALATSSSTVGVSVVMNYGPGGGKMKVGHAWCCCNPPMLTLLLMICLSDPKQNFLSKLGLPTPRCRSRN